MLTGSEITDLRILLIAGKAHTKHTEGGDFRQATYRAIRQGLRSGKSILLEPWFSYRLEVPTENLGRAMSDITRMNGRFDPPVTEGNNSVLMGSVPVATMRDYAREVASYTKGHGRLSCSLQGYEPCHNPEEVDGTDGLRSGGGYRQPYRFRILCPRGRFPGAMGSGVGICPCGERLGTGFGGKCRVGG